MVGVVQFQVGDHSQVGLEFDQGSVGFIGLRHQQSAGPLAPVAAEGGNDAADHGGGVVVGAGQQGGNQGAGGRFAMAAGHGDGGLVVDQGRQHIRAMPDRQPAAARFRQLRVGFSDSGADHHHRTMGGAAPDRGDRGGALLPEDAHAALPQGLEYR